MKKLIIGLSAFCTISALADVGAFYCHSEMMKPYKQYEKAYVQTNSCDNAKGSFFGSSAYEKAKEECSKWAKGLGIKNHQMKFFSGEDYYHKCQKENVGIYDNLKAQKFNTVEAFTYTNQYPGGSNIIWSNLFVDNFSNQKPILRRDGSEQAQWIKHNGTKYCGVLGKKIAFLLKGDTFEVVRLSNAEKALYKRTRYFNTYAATAKLRDLNADYLDNNLVQAGTSSLSMYNMVGPHKEDVLRIEMYYDESSSICK